MSAQIIPFPHRDPDAEVHCHLATRAEIEALAKAPGYLGGAPLAHC